MLCRGRCAPFAFVWSGGYEDYTEHVERDSFLLDTSGPTVVFEADQSLVLDRHSVVSHAIITEAVQGAIEKAKRSGAVLRQCATRIITFLLAVGESRRRRGIDRDDEHEHGVLRLSDAKCRAQPRYQPYLGGLRVAGEERMFLQDMATTVMALLKALPQSDL